MHYLLTGHTGFKGSWLTLMLQALGHEVSGIALDPEPESLFLRLGLEQHLRQDTRVDIRDKKALAKAVGEINPDAVIHLAAQPLVHESYRDPVGTFETNAQGTVNLLKALSGAPNVRGCLVITTDKVYRNDGRLTGYVESDPLGGEDPYSASKAMADMATQSWRVSFSGPPTAIARAGNVIGGGDTSRDRLVPDLLSAFKSERPALIRNPDAVRPWQHVLDCLRGYLLLVDQVLEQGVEGEWNFGPDPAGMRTVEELATLAAVTWGDGASWQPDHANHPHEAATLTLDASKARDELGWRDHLDFETAIGWTINWEHEVASGASTLAITRQQVETFLAS